MIFCTFLFHSNTSNELQIFSFYVTTMHFRTWYIELLNVFEFHDIKSKSFCDCFFPFQLLVIKIIEFIVSIRSQKSRPLKDKQSIMKIILNRILKCTWTCTWNLLMLIYREFFNYFCKTRISTSQIIVTLVSRLSYRVLLSVISYNVWS